MSMNESFQDGQDIFSDLDLNATTTYHMRNIDMVVYMISELLKLIVCAGSLGATIVLLYVLLKFERLKKGGNIYFLHYAFCNLTDLFVIPIYQIIHELLLRHFLGYAVMCVVFWLSTYIVLFNLFIAFALIIDWLLIARNHKWVQNYNKFQRNILIIIYSITVLLFILTTGECYTNIYIISSEITRIIYVIIFLMSIIVNIYVKRTQLTQEHLKTKYQLTIANIMILSYLPLLISWAFYLLVSNHEEYTVPMMIASSCENLSAILIYSLPIIVVYLLGRLDKHFKQAYDTIFKRSTKSYENNDLDGENSDGEEVLATNNTV